MKPTNNDTPTCNPISSNCVIWQGPDIDCIKLCKGDTVSDVVFKLATELCTIMTELNISSYDLTCLNLVGCDPKDFQALLQLLIDKICALDACCNQTPGIGKSGCPDCVVTVCSDFEYDDQYGNHFTTMQLSDYVIAIGNRVCSIIHELAIINQTLVAYNIRITALENAPDPDISIPTVTPVCVLPSTPTEVQIVVAELEKQYCLLVGATGQPTAIYSAIAQECPGLSASPVLGPGGGNLGSLPGWINPEVNLANNINNLWLTICDLRSAVLNIQTNCCPSGCDGITLLLQAVVEAPNTLRIYITGTIPAGFLECSGLGTLFTISDTLGGSFTQYIDVITNLNNPGGFPIDLSVTAVNPASNINITTTVCLTNATTNATCSTALVYLVNNEAPCPVLTLTPAVTSIAYSYVVPSVSGTYTIQLYNNAGTLLVAQNINAVVAPNTITGTFTGLTSSTPYKVRVLVNIGGSVTTCPFTPAVTLPGPCPPPSGVSAIITVI